MNHAKILKQVLKLNRRLVAESARLDLAFDCNVRIVDYSETFVQYEDGRAYQYPETLGINIENKSTHKFDVRITDGRWIRCGRDLNGPGLSLFKVYRAMIRELRAAKGGA